MILPEVAARINFEFHSGKYDGKPCVRCNGGLEIEKCRQVAPAGGSGRAEDPRDGQFGGSGRHPEVPAGDIASKKWPSRGHTRTAVVE